MSLETSKLELKGAAELQRELKKFGPAVAKRGRNLGIRRTVAHLTRQFRKAAPKQSGMLRKAIQGKYSAKYGRGWVELAKIKGDYRSDGNLALRGYYKTLEFDTARGKALRPFFGKTWERWRRDAAHRIIKETRRALYEEAGKAYARSKLRNRRR